MESRSFRELTPETLASLIVDREDVKPTLKEILESKRETEMMRALKKFVADKDVEIEKFCNICYQQFVDSFDSLLTFRSDIAGMKSTIVNSNSDLQEEGSRLLSKSAEFTRLQKIKSNLDNSLEFFEKCHHCVTLCGSLEVAMKKENYIRALNLAHRIEADLEVVSQFEFSSLIRNRISVVKKTIRRKVESQFTDWLLQARNHASTLGSRVVRNAAKDVGVQGSGSFDGRLVEIMEDALFKDIDFTPVYQALHIFENMGIVDEFLSVYRENRMEQARLVVEPRWSSSFLESYESFLSEIVGFFVIEDKIIRTSGNLLTRAWVEPVWDFAMTKMQNVLKEKLREITSPKALLELKRFLMAVIKSLASYSYNCLPLTEYLGFITQRYVECFMDGYRAKLITLWKTIADGSLGTTGRNGVEITGQAQYSKQVAVFNLDPDPKRDVKNASFPLIMPYSIHVPMSFDFVTEVVSNLSETSSVIRKAADDFLGIVAEMFTDLLQERPMTVMRAMQVAQDVRYMVAGYVYIEKILNIKNASVGTTASNFSSRDVFMDTARSAADVMLSLLEEKVGKFVSLAANQNWTPPPDSKQVYARQYVEELVTFLQDTFAKMEGLEADLRNRVHMICLEGIADAFFQLLKSNSLKKFNMNAIIKLDADVSHLERFADSVATDVPKLSSYLTQVRQVLDLFMDENFDLIIEHRIQREKYPSLTVRDLITILDKYKEGKSPKGSKYSLSGKRVEKVVKQLRAQVDVGGN